MAKVDANKTTTKSKDTSRSPALSDRAKYIQITNDALNLLGERIRNGTATSQELVKGVSLASEYERFELERETMIKQQTLLDAKVEDLKAQKQSAEFYQQAIKAIHIYSGEDSHNDEEVLVDDQVV